MVEHPHYISVSNKLTSILNTLFQQHVKDLKKILLTNYHVTICQNASSVTGTFTYSQTNQDYYYNFWGVRWGIETGHQTKYV